MSVTTEFSFVAELFEWDGPQAWVFTGLPEDLADVIQEVHGERARGFRSLRVEVSIGGQIWRTSIFPDSKRGTYLLPVKAGHLSPPGEEGDPAQGGRRCRRSGRHRSLGALRVTGNRPGPWSIADGPDCVGRLIGGTLAPIRSSPRGTT